MTKKEQHEVMLAVMAEAIAERDQRIMVLEWELEKAKKQLNQAEHAHLQTLKKMEEDK